MSKLTIDIENTKPFICDKDLEGIQKEISEIHAKIEKGECAGNDYLGWMRIPSTFPDELINKINDIAQFVNDNADVFISIGIGGSYLGAKAAVEFANHSFLNKLSHDKRKGAEVYFAGQNISSDYLADLIDIVRDKRVCINVISKSGTTMEPAVTFRILRELVEKIHGKEEAKKRIIVTTDRKKGALKRLADEKGYTTFEIPDDVGGRFSVLTPVGLIPMAVSGINIDELLNGAKLYEDITANTNLQSNPAYLYAAVRNILYRNGKTIELLSSFHPSLHYLGEWWKQLAGESEGKNLSGVFPASLDFTTDLHSMGQWIQDGRRVIFETFLLIEKSNREIKIPVSENDGDELNYLAGKSLDYVNDKAYKGTAIAHKEGNVPNMSIILKDRSPDALGQIFYFFEKAIAISGYLQKVNPFDQPGVEFYKKNMFALLGKPANG
ncbi:MAG: glucose-6-phosphate isomerase [Candidatus Anammoxibacter sp.]